MYTHTIYTLTHHLHTHTHTHVPPITLKFPFCSTLRWVHGDGLPNQDLQRDELERQLHLQDSRAFRVPHFQGDNWSHDLCYPLLCHHQSQPHCLQQQFWAVRFILRPQVQYQSTGLDHRWVSEFSPLSLNHDNECLPQPNSSSSTLSQELVNIPSQRNRSSRSLNAADWCICRTFWKWSSYWITY